VTRGRLLDPDLLLRAYRAGIFPMAESRDDSDVYWVEPKQRGILPLSGFHLSRSLAKVIRRDVFRVTVNQAFEAVMRACAAPDEGREDSWISAPIIDAYSELHRSGHAHSVECWIGDQLVGGLYGVAIERGFFGESMFSTRTDASKVALAYLVARLKVGGFTLLDCQFLTPHLASLGAIEISRDDYVGLLAGAVAGAVTGAGADGAGAGAPPPDFFALDFLPSPAGAAAVIVSGPASGQRIVQLLGQTS
jgi:leucyl/phenylalanyl-tRNA--protein transferase